ncbi:hypothetical protein F5B21DRAFT_495883 [Xylaria acuta]|nr:hypothetical protein F5B21DRAFT_495883 [Xylaria acuta]
MATLELSREPAGYIAGLSALAAIATLAVGLRIWVTTLTRAGLHFDDWVSLVTIVTCHGLTATIFLAFISYGLGHSTADLAQADLWVIVGLEKISVAASILHVTASFAAKLAVLGFCARIFPTRATKWGCYALAGIGAAWFLITVVVTFAACRSLGSVWDPTIDGHCFDGTDFPTALAALNVVIDAATVVLPIYEVSKLQLPKRKKYTVVSIFVIGGLATGAGLARFIGILFTVSTSIVVDPARISSLLYALAIIEVYISIIGACVPTLGPLYDKFRGGRNTSTAQSHSHSRSGGKSSKGQSKTYVKMPDRTTSRSRLRNEDDVEGSSERLEGASISSTPAESISYWTDTSRGAGANASKVEDIPLRAVHIQRDRTR